jgi:hypothetical protein
LPKICSPITTLPTEIVSLIKSKNLFNSGIRSPNYNQRSPSSFCYAKTTATYHTSALAPKQLMRNSTSFDSNIITASPTQEFPKFLVEAIQKANEKRASLNFGKDHVFNDTDSACSEKGCDDDKVPPGVEKPVCSKKFVKRFVEEDDANSVVTNEEGCLKDDFAMH